MRRLPVIVVVAFSAALAFAQGRPAPGDAAGIAAVYSGAAERILGAALVDDTAYRRLEWLSDRIGNRLSGSPALDAAIAWAQHTMTADGLDVRLEKVMVPHWVRGKESAELTEPVKRPLVMLGLGNSVGTAPDGISAEVVVVKDYAALEALGENARGKIVLYDVPYVSYGETVAYRNSGPSRAAKQGAVAVLVRSVGPVSLRTPHTGMLHYDDEQPRIPAAAITIEDSTALARMQARGEKIVVRLTMEAKMLPDVESANVVASLPGSEHPEEVVLVGGHLDSWDVGQGSTDDGGGAIASWEALRLVKRLGLPHRRTLRAVLFTNEENGTRGAFAYHDAHKKELGDHVLVIESDGGVTRPSGFGLSKTAAPSVRATISAIARLLHGINADLIGADGGGADIDPMVKDGVVTMSLNVDESHYFDIDHTQADTFEKIDRTNLGLCVGSLGVMAYVAADLPERLK